MLEGSLHIYIVDFGMDIRGFRVQYSLDCNDWKISYPHKSVFFADENKHDSFPVIQFTDPEKTKELRKLIKKKASKYIRENYFSEGMEAELKKIEGKKRFTDKKLPFKPHFYKEQKKQEKKEPESLWKKNIGTDFRKLDK